MAFALFLLVTATLFVRPAEIVPDLAGLPVYEWLILSCLAVSLPQLAKQLHPRSLGKRPITLCVFGMWGAIALSHLSRLDFWSTRYASLDFAKVVIYYLLLLANVNSPARLRTFLLWLAGCIVAVVTLALLQFHGAIDIPSLAALEEIDFDPESGETYLLARLRSTGIYNDPNDLSMLLVLGLMIAAYHLIGPRRRFAPVWLAAGALFCYALVLTRSRGGLLGLLVALGLLFQARYGWRKAIVLGAAMAPLLALLAGGRQADFGGALEGGTGQDRVQLWSAGLSLFRGAPLFGIGSGFYEEHVGHVAHNSYLHCFTELGLFVGAIFLMAFLYPLRELHRLKSKGLLILDRNLARLRPSLLGALAGYAAGMLSLSRPYVTPTYMLLGLATVYLDQTRTLPPLIQRGVDRRLLKQVAVASLIYLAATYAFVRVVVRWE